DDDEDIAASIADVLRGGGYDVAQAVSGGEALMAAARSTPGLVLLDWRLPTEPAGSALVRKLRDTCGYNVPVVVLSADPQPEAEARLARAPRAPLADGRIGDGAERAIFTAGDLLEDVADEGAPAAVGVEDEDDAIGRHTRSRSAASRRSTSSASLKTWAEARS